MKKEKPEAESSVPTEKQDPSNEQLQAWRCWAKLTWGACLYNWSHVLSPLKRWCFAQARHEPVSVEWHDVFDGVCGILIPMLIYGPVIVFLRNSLLPLSTIGPNDAVPSALPNLVYPYLCCPWTLHCIHSATKPAVQLTLNSATISILGIARSIFMFKWSHPRRTGMPNTIVRYLSPASFIFAGSNNT